MEYNRAETIDNYLELVNSGKMDFTELRQNLSELDIDEEEIKIVIRYIDRQVIKNTQNKTSHSLGKNQFYGGITLALFGLIFTIGSFLNLFNFEGITVLAYGPIGAGLSIAFYGYNQMNKE